MGTSFVSSSECCCATIHSLFFTKFDSSVGQTQQTMVTMDYFACICSKNCFASFHVRWRHFRVGAGSINYFDDNERADS
jgi:hypothetical protein